MKNLMFLYLISLTYSCATAGAGQEPIGEGQWQVRVWDGNKCTADRLKKVPEKDEACKSALMPIMEAEAARVCNSEPQSITDCWLNDAFTGRRLKCNVRCK